MGNRAVEIIEGNLTITASDSLAHASYAGGGSGGNPNLPAERAVELLPPSPSLKPSAKGKVVRVTARWNTGGGITAISDVQLSLYRNLNEYPNGETVYNAAGTDLALSTAREERKVFVSEVVGSPSASGTTPFIDEFIEPPKSFEAGLWIVLENGTVTGSGEAIISYAIELELDRV